MSSVYHFRNCRLEYSSSKALTLEHVTNCPSFACFFACLLLVEVNYFSLYSLLSFNLPLLLVFTDVYLYSFLLIPLLASALCWPCFACVASSLVIGSVVSLLGLVSLDVMLCLLVLASWYIVPILDGSSMAHFIFLKTM